jgi:hypothetical protein
MFRLFFQYIKASRQHQRSSSPVASRETVPMERIDQVRALVREMEVATRKIRQSTMTPPEHNPNSAKPK